VTAALQVSPPSTGNVARLRTFVSRFAQLLDVATDEVSVLTHGAQLLGELVSEDDWLPDAYARPSRERYQQYLLHCDSRERFSVVSFVWGPGQETPIHDHRVWGLVGVLRGAELNQSYRRDARGVLHEDSEAERLEVGGVATLSPSGKDIHRVRNAYADRTSISIHVYGANIGAVERATYDERGQPKAFISGYANVDLPNLWDRSKSS
jgi:predicted metal-dependent enzyme (double-stranded beta helix superfamily)